MLNNCYFNQTKKQFLLQLMQLVHGDKTDLIAFLGTSTKHTVISLFVNVFKIHELRYFYLLVAAVLNACSVISCNWYGSTE